MKEIWNWIQVVFAAIGGWLGYVLGGLDGFLYALLAFVVIDYITGLMCAVLDKKLSSEVGFRGIFKKVLIFSLVAVGHIVDQNVIGDGSVIRTAVIFFYLSTPTEPKKLYRVQVGAYSVKANADAMLKRVKAAGFKGAFIKYSE